MDKKVTKREERAYTKTVDANTKFRVTVAYRDGVVEDIVLAKPGGWWSHTFYITELIATRDLLTEVIKEEGFDDTQEH